MKKILIMSLSVLLIFTMTACNQEVNKTDSNTDGFSKETISDVSEESESDKEVSPKSNKQNNKKKNTSKSTKKESIKNDTKSSTEEDSYEYEESYDYEDSYEYEESYDYDVDSLPEDSSFDNEVTSSNSTSTTNIDNGVLEKVTTKKMDVPENIKLLGTNKAKEENNANSMQATVAVYHLDGDVVNWTTENDLIYTITSGNNRLVVINSKNMMAVKNVPLAGKPAEINLIGDEIYISLPDLCRIDVFSKSSLAKKSSLFFDHEVSSFCIDGDYIYYSEHDQHCDVYRKNVITNELIEILPDRGFSFYFPKLYLNKQDNVLYIGETNSSGSTIFYYDATTLQLKSFFRKNDYGLNNHTRDIFHVGNEIFWAGYRLSDTNAKEIIGRYGEGNSGSVNFVSEDLVSTFKGLYLTDTYECIIDYFNAGFSFQYILLTESNNVFFRARSTDRNIILGVNFDVL